MTDRAQAAAAFVADAGWGAATRRTIAGDASNRRYDRLTDPDGRSVILMDAPPEKGEDVRPFVRIAGLLRDAGLSAPAVIAADEALGFLLLEDLGDAVFARVLEDRPELESRLYEAAIDVLVALHAAPAPRLEAYTAQDMTEKALLAFDWYQRAALGHISAARDRAEVAISRLLEPIEPSVLIQRDYHAENLIWLPEREGVARVGLLDFQDAMLGHPAYDLCSILLDARRDASADVQARMLDRYVDRAGVIDRDGFVRAYWALALQRNLRIVGVFARLCVRDGKAHYVDLLPRVWRHVEAALEALEDDDLKEILRDALPAPSAGICERIKAQCPMP